MMTYQGGLLEGTTGRVYRYGYLSDTSGMMTNQGGLLEGSTDRVYGYGYLSHRLRVWDDSG